MLRSKLIGANIIDFRNQTVLGSVAEMLYDDKNPAVRAFALKNNWSSKINIVTVDEILEITDGYMIVNNEDSVSSLDDNIRMKSLVDQKCFDLKQKIYTKSGRKIGTVYDMVIDTTNFNILKYYTKFLFSEKIISSYHIISYSPKKIVIKDEFEKIKQSVPAVEPAEIDG